MPSLKLEARAALAWALALTASCVDVVVQERPDAGRADSGSAPVEADELDASVVEDPDSATEDQADAASSPISESRAVATLDQAGGKLALEGIVEVAVPPDALVEQVNLGARLLAQGEVPVALPMQVSAPVVELIPHGRLFDLPITIKLPYAASADVQSLAVLRLDDPQDVDWEWVSGVRYENGIASFESTTFSYYTVVTFPEPTCASLPAASAACAGACSASQYCSGGTACAEVAQNNLCGNAQIIALHSGESTVDNPSATELATALAGNCGRTAVIKPLSDTTTVQACSSELLIGGGTTVVLAGGPFTNPALRYLDRRISPVFLDSPDGNQQQFKTRAGNVLLQFDPTTITPSHDYFMIQIYPDTARGSLVISAFGREGPGTRAATYYFVNTVAPALKAGTRSWSGYLIGEWTDSGDKIPNAADTFTVKVSEPLPPPPPVTPPPPTVETPYQANATGTLATGQSVNAAAGYKFTPQVNGKVTALGGYFSGTKTVKLFKGSTVLATASVAGNNTWVYKDITPVAVTAGTQYTVAVYLGGSGGAKRTTGPTLPKVAGNIRLDAPTQATTTILTPNAVPSTSSSPTTTMLGLADIKFLRD